MEGLFSSWDLCKRTNGLHHWNFRWIRLCIFPHLHPLQCSYRGVQSEVPLSLSLFFCKPLLKLYCTVWIHPIPVAQINLHQLSTWNRPRMYSTRTPSFISLLPARGNLRTWFRAPVPLFWLNNTFQWDASSRQQCEYKSVNRCTPPFES